MVNFTEIDQGCPKDSEISIIVLHILWKKIWFIIVPLSWRTANWNLTDKYAKATWDMWINSGWSGTKPCKATVYRSWESNEEKQDVFLAAAMRTSSQFCHPSLYSQQQLWLWPPTAHKVIICDDTDYALLFF